MKALISKQQTALDTKKNEQAMLNNEKIFSTADLWNIERRKRISVQRRFI
jgi:hypothetical protein